MAEVSTLQHHYCIERDPMLPSSRANDTWIKAAVTSEKVTAIFPSIVHPVHENVPVDETVIFPAGATRRYDLSAFRGTGINLCSGENGYLAALRAITVRDVMMVYDHNGPLFFNRDGLFPFSRTLPRFNIKLVRPAEHFENALFIGDRFNTPNLMHFVMDHLSRAIIAKDCDALSGKQILTADPGLDYSKLMASHIAPSYRALAPQTVYSFDTLTVLSDSLYEFYHPARLCQPHLVDTLSNCVGDLKAPHFARRVYVSRGDARMRRVQNEESLLPILKSRGFSILQGGDLSPIDQMRLMANADVVVAPHGAALTSLLFARPETKVIELLGNYGTAAYSILSQSRGLDYRPLFGTDLPAAEAAQIRNFTVDPEKLAAALDAIGVM